MKKKAVIDKTADKMFRKICSKMLSMILLCTSAASCLTIWPMQPVHAQESSGYSTYEQLLKGSEATISEEDRILIEISTQEELEALAKSCMVDSWSEDKLIRLEADIVLQGDTELVIPSFGGIFDGNGHRIANLLISQSGSSLGLFRYLRQNGVIRNLTVEGNIKPDGSRSQVGGIAGTNYGKIEQCIFSGNLEGDNEIGGIAGCNGDSGEIRNCISYGNILGNHYTGGIAGRNQGTISHCRNQGAVNTYSTEVTYDLEDITIERLEDLNAASNVQAYTDAGGIAGLSEGKIYYCTNSGTVGYQHVGYNIGGIVGRVNQGYVQNCTNTGHVLGRKDVGGIAGQLEPFLELQYLNDNLTRLDQELDTMIDLLDGMHSILSSNGKEASRLSKELSTHLKNVSTAAGNLTSTGNDLWYIYNQELTGMNHDLKNLNQEIGDLVEKDKQELPSETPQVSSGDVKESTDDWEKPGAGTQAPNWELPDPDDSDIELPDVSGIEFPDLDASDIEFPDPDDSDFDLTISDDMESYLSALKKFGENTSSHLDTITSATTDRSGGITHNLEILDLEMKAAGDKLEQLTQVLQDTSDASEKQMDAIVEQARVLRSLMSSIRDDLFGYEGIVITDSSDEAAAAGLTEAGAMEKGSETEGSAQSSQSDPVQKATDLSEKQYDTESFKKGKITRCLNQGTVEADTNVGGIVGLIATEYDFDPEDDISRTDMESFDMEQTVKAVVRESRNLGGITGKKDFAGGIAGKADFGAIISCESYGDVTSTGGSYVGGIAGFADYAVRSCYSMGSLSGKNYVGGIAGRGGDIFQSCSMITIEAEGERCGAIAGDVKDSGNLYGNYYVEGKEGGIDGIGYDRGAAPLSYEAFCQLKQLPQEFYRFQIVFQAEGKVLGTVSCEYGDGIDKEQIPQIPEKEGYYSFWPEFDFSCITGNRVLEAEYEKWVSSLASSQMKEQQPVLMTEGEFLPQSVLNMAKEGEEITFWIDTEEEAYDKPVTVHYLCSQEQVQVEILTEQGSYLITPKVVGSYLVFEMDRPGTFRLVAETKERSVLPYAAAILAVCLLIVIIWIFRKRVSGKNPPKQEAEESAVS